MKSPKYKIYKYLLLAALALISAGVISACAAPVTEFTFDACGGSVTQSALTVTVGEGYTLPTPTRDGYSFDGWYYSSDYSGGAAPLSGTAADENAGKKLYAKWIKLYTVTLDAGGGTVDKSTFTLAENENLYNKISGVTPSRSGAQFGEWQLGGKALDKNYKINADVTLTAKYKWQYAVEYYLQNQTADGYEKSVDLSFVDYAYAGTTVEAEEHIKGFTLSDSHGQNLSLTVAENAGNVVKAYFDRNVFNVTFKANYPDGSDEDIVEKVVYGASVAVPTDVYSYEGYYLVGWATSKNGEKAYSTNQIENAVINKDATDGVLTPDSVAPVRHTALYAVWQKGYVNKLGGDDYLYLSDSSDKVIYLSRGGVYFKGRYSKANKSFSFFSEGEELLYGVIYDDGTYIYGDGDRAETSAKLYVRGSGTDEHTVVYFDEYDGIRYVVSADGATDVSEGSYYVDENGTYFAAFTKGSLKDKEICFNMGYVTVNGLRERAFQLRNETEFGMGEITRYFINESGLMYYPEHYKLTLNGFGTATITSGGGASTYAYSYDEDEKIISVTSASGVRVFTAKYYDNEVIGYFIYNEALDNTYVGDDGTLTLDGAARATFTPAGGESVSGYYYAENSVFGGNVVTMVAGNKTYKFVVNAVTNTAMSGETGDADDDTDAEPTTQYTLSEKSTDYSEYYYKGETDVFYYPLIVVGNDDGGDVLVYGRNGNQYVLALAGTSEKAADDSYTFTVRTRYDVETDSTVVNLKKVNSFVYRLATVTINNSGYKVNYWLSREDTDGSFDYVKTYSGEGGDKLKLVSGFAALTGSRNITGEYKTDGNILTISDGQESVYVELVDASTFVKLTETPYTAVLGSLNCGTDENATLSFDGKGGATFVFGGETYVGALEKTGGFTYFGDEIFRFTGLEGALFILAEEGGVKRFYIFNEAINGEYETDGGALILDGFGYKAEFDEQSGYHVGAYDPDNTGSTITVTADGNTYIFDYVKGWRPGDGAQFTLRGSEYATYAIVDNGDVSGAAEFDGYGKAVVYKIGADGNKQVIDENGVYGLIDGNLYRLTYKVGGENRALTLQKGTFDNAGGKYLALYVVRDLALSVYVNGKDWNTLILDDVGGAVRYSTKGEKTVGRYVFVTGTMLYFEATDGSFACVYDYDNLTGYATPRNFDARGYYTEDLKSILFTQYGFVLVSDGESTERLYYNMDDNDVVIYRRDEADPNANEFGFTSENFGRFTDKKTYNGKEYIANAGLAIRFERTGEVQDYPIQTARGSANFAALSFTPDGNAEFSVSGRLTLVNAPDAARAFTIIENCTVQRKLEGGVYKTYVTLSSGAWSFRLSVDLNYKGTDGDGASLSSYEITGLTNFRDLVSYSYLNNLYYIYLFQGAGRATEYENEIGSLEIYGNFDNEGGQGETYVTTDFNEKSGIFVDSLGNPVTFKDVTAYQSANNFWHAAATGADGYEYGLHFVVLYNSPLSTYGFAVYAFTKSQSVTNGDGYELTIETVLYSDYQAIPAGAVFTMSLKKGGESLTADTAVAVGGVWHYVTRTYENNKIVSTTYYKLDLTVSGTGGVEEDTAAPVYSSLKVTAMAMETYYTEDGLSYVDVDTAAHKIYYINKSGSVYVVTQCDFDEQTGVYTVKTNAGKTFEIKVENKNVNIIEA